MTIPSLMNCKHLADGVCIECVAEMITAEREACAKLVSDIGDELAERGNAHAVDACDFIEDAIRMRSNAELTGDPLAGSPS